MEYPVLEFRHIRLCFPLREIQIGGRAGSHIRLLEEQYQDCRVSLKFGEKNGTWQVFVQSAPGIWLNDRFYIPQTEGISLKSGDVLQIGSERFQFQEGDAQIKIEPEAPEEEFIRLPTPRTWEVATESLRIVGQPRQPGFTSRQKLAQGGMLLFIALMSYCLVSGKFLTLRTYLTRKFPAASAREVPPEPSAADQGQWNSTDVTGQKKIARKERPRSRCDFFAWFDFAASHLALNLRWRNAGAVPLVWVDQGELEIVQRQMFDYVRQGKLAEAELLYTGSIFPKISADIKAFENAARYNGWAIGLLRMSQEWEKTRDPGLRRRLARELKILEMQSSLYVTSPVSREFFRRLHAHIAGRLKD